METFIEWAKYYQKMEVWVFPYNELNNEKNHWKYWRDKIDIDYQNESVSYDWFSAKGINAVVGKKGIRVIYFKIDENDKKQIYVIKVLEALGLSKDYTWVLENENIISIIVDTVGNVKDGKNKSYKNCGLIWEGNFLLPSSESNTHFYNKIPIAHPTQISNNKLYSCLENIENESILYEIDNPIEWKPIIKVCSIFLLLALLVYIVTPTIKVVLAMIAAYVGTKLFKSKNKQGWEKRNAHSDSSQKTNKNEI